MRLNGIRTPVKLVCMDWNGTLLADWDIAYLAMREQFGAYGLPSPTEEEYREGISADYIEFYMSHGFPRPATKKGIAALKADLNRIRSAFLRKHWWEVKLNPGVENFLRFLSDKRILAAVVSAEEPNVLQERLVQFQIRSYLGLHTGECIYIDDTRDGLVSAKNCGMRAVGMLGGYNSWAAVLSAEPEFATTHFSEIQDQFS